MPHPSDSDSGLLIDGFLEGKEDKHVINDLADLLEPPLAPRPDLRAVEEDDWNSQCLSVCRKFEVEPGIVDADERIRTLLLQSLLEGVEQSVEPGQMTHDLNKSVDLQIVKGRVEP